MTDTLRSPAEQRLAASSARTLAELGVGETARICGLNCEDDRHRSALLNLGFIPGTRVSLVRVAPLGDPVEIRIRGFRVGLRRSEAACIRVEAT